MSLHPSIQEKVHAELDAVVGPNRLPDFSDRQALVYLNAVIKEAMRWMPSAPLGLTHCTREDDIVNGYFIPAGTVLLGNIWYANLPPSAYVERLSLTVSEGHVYTTQQCMKTRRRSTRSGFSATESPTQTHRTRMSSPSGSVGGACSDLSDLPCIHIVSID